MKARLLAVAALLCCTGIAQSDAGTIGPNDFGSNAVVETFDFAPVVGHLGPLLSNGVTYSFGLPDLYSITDSTCVSGACLGNFVSGAFLIITLQNPVDRVGGYLTGSWNNTGSRVSFFDSSDTFIGSSSPVDFSGNGDIGFFGFESLTDPIAWLQIDPNSGPQAFQLDNFTTEVVTPLPAALPLFAGGLGALGLLGWRRKSKLAKQAS